MRNKEYPLFTALFVAAALWNLLGAAFGYLHPDFTFQHLFGRTFTDPLLREIYRGAWGTTLTYFVGYLLVAYNPTKHTGIVLVGGIGKLAFAIGELHFYLAGYANSLVLIIVFGDLLFTAFFLQYFLTLYRHKRPFF